MAKQKEILPKTCPLHKEELREFHADWHKGKPGISHALYGCGCDLILYKIPTGWRMDITEAPKVKELKPGIKTEDQPDLFKREGKET